MTTFLDWIIGDIPPWLIILLCGSILVNFIMWTQSRNYYGLYKDLLHDYDSLFESYCKSKNIPFEKTKTQK